MVACSKQDSPIFKPSIISVTVSSIKATTASLNAKFENVDSDNYKGGFLIGYQSGVTMENAFYKQESSISSEKEEMTLTASLICDTTCYATAYIENKSDGSRIFGDEISFNTLAPSAQITKSYDEFEKLNIYYANPYGDQEQSIRYLITASSILKISLTLLNGLNNVQLIKATTQNNETYYYLSIDYIKSTSEYYKKGTYLLFKDDSQIRWEDADIDCDMVEYGGKVYNTFRYSSFTSVSNEQLHKLQTSLLSKIRIYVYDITVSPTQAYNIMRFAKALETFE